MQQTDKYKLNKPGPDDPISPLPLNENMDKVEAALSAETAARQAALSAETAARQAALSAETAAREAALSAETAAREAADAALDGRVTAVNGRVTTVDNRVTAVDGRRVLDHLLTATAPEGVKEFTIDLTPYNPSQYGALVMVFVGVACTKPMELTINDTNQSIDLMARSSGSGSSYSGGGLAVLVPALEYTYGAAMSGGAFYFTNSGTTGGRLSVPWAELASFTLSPLGTYAMLALYGLRL